MYRCLICEHEGSTTTLEENRYCTSLVESQSVHTAILAWQWQQLYWRCFIFLSVISILVCALSLAMMYAEIITLEPIHLLRFSRAASSKFSTLQWDKVKGSTNEISFLPLAALLVQCMKRNVKDKTCKHRWQAVTYAMSLAMLFLLA